jgi:hypothetical protein
MPESNTPKKLSPAAISLMSFVVITIAQIIGKTSAAGDVDGQFVTEAVIRAAIASAFIFIVGRLIRSSRRS